MGGVHHAVWLFVPQSCKNAQGLPRGGVTGVNSSNSPVLGVEERRQLAARDAGTDGHLVAGTAFKCVQETAVGISNDRAAY